MARSSSLYCPCQTVDRSPLEPRHWDFMFNSPLSPTYRDLHYWFSSFFLFFRGYTLDLGPHTFEAGLVALSHTLAYFKCSFSLGTWGCIFTTSWIFILVSVAATNVHVDLDAQLMGLWLSLIECHTEAVGYGAQRVSEFGLAGRRHASSRGQGLGSAFY